MVELQTTFKVLILGDSGVGKSCILYRFTDDAFEDETEVTIGSDFRTKELVVDDVEVKLAVWDTAGQERFHSLIPSLYRNTHCAILVYDVTNRKSFLNLNKWLEDVRNSTEYVILMVVGNKSDLEGAREVTKTEGINFAKSINSLFMETSAKNSTGVNEAFTELVRKAVQTPNLYQPVCNTVSLLDGEAEPDNTGLCARLKC